MVWTTEEKTAVLKHFRDYSETHRLPGKQKIQKVISAEPALHARKWTSVKDFIIHNLKKTDPLGFL